MAVYTETFTGTNETSPPNANWTNKTNGIKIENNAASGVNADVINAAFWDTNAFNEKHYAKCVTLAWGVGGPAIRIATDAANSFYYCVADSNGVYNGEMVAGTPSDWDAGQDGVATGSTVELWVDATTSTSIVYKVNGSTVYTYTSKSALSGGSAGVCCFGTTEGTPGQVDNWEGGDVVSSISITPVDGAQPQTGDAVICAAIYLISAVEGAQAQTGDAATVSASYTPNVTPAEGTQSQTGDLATLNSICILTPAENTQSQSGDAATVSAQNPAAGPTMIGPLYPGTATSAAVTPYDDDDWVSPGNISADDGAYASIVVPSFDANNYSYMLSARVFGATVPTDGTISGIVSEIGKYRSAGTAIDAVVQLINGIGTTLGTNYAGTANWPASKATSTYGGSADLWGTALTPALVNGTSFGLQFAAQATGANTDIWVDFIRLYIYYYPSTLGPNVTPAEGAQTQVGDAAAANAISAIVPVEGAQTQAGDAALVAGIIAVLPAEGAQSQAGDAPTVSASYTPNVTAVEGTQTQAGDPATLVATSSLTPGEGAQTQAGDAAILAAINAVTPGEGVQSQAQDAAVVSIAIIITPAEGAQTQTGDVPTLGWIAVVTPEEGAQTQSGDIATFSLAGAITPAEGAQTQNQDAAILGWIGLLTPGEGTQSQSGDEVAVWAISAIGPAEGAQSQTQDPATVTFGGIPTINITPDEGAQGQTQDAAIAYHLTPIPPGEGFQTQSMDAAVATGYAPTYSITAAEGAQTQTNDPAIIYAIYWIAAAEGNQTQVMDLVTVTSSEEGYRVEATPGARRTIITQDNVPEAELRRILKAR